MTRRFLIAFAGSVFLVSGCATTQSQMGSSIIEAMTRLDARRQVLVTMRPAPPWVLEARTSTIGRDYRLRPVYAWPLMSIDVHCVVYTIMDEREPSAVSEALAADPRVESAQPLHVFRVLGQYHNDPYYHLQQNHQTIQMGEVHRWATGKGVRVAVVDSGVDFTHPDLRDRILRVERFVGMNRPDADRHGTAVAGVIAATANNDIGIVGIAPQAEVMSLKACFEDGSGTPAQCNTFGIVMAVEVAIMERAHVLNLSLTGPHDRLLERVIAAATGRGIAVVAACDEQLEDVSFPASVERVIAVRSVDLEGRPRGPIHGSRAGTLAAPGVDVLTTVPGGGYDFVTGSSFAAAHLSGVVALLIERQPHLSPLEIAALLQSTADVLETASPTANGSTKILVVNVQAAFAKLTGRGNGLSGI